MKPAARNLGQAGLSYYVEVAYACLQIARCPLLSRHGPPGTAERCHLTVGSSRGVVSMEGPEMAGWVRGRRPGWGGGKGWGGGETTHTCKTNTGSE